MASAADDGGLERFLEDLSVEEMPEYPQKHQVNAVIEKLAEKRPDVRSEDDHHRVFLQRKRWVFDFTMRNEDQDMQRKFIDYVIRAVMSVESGREGQIYCLHGLIYKKIDIGLQARTGYGKTAVLFIYTVITEKMTIIVTPLTALGKDQLKLLKTVIGAKPLFIDRDTKHNNPRALDNLLNGEYNYIIISPEGSMGKQFRDVLRNPAFQANIGLIAIDEAHCISEWRNFRPDYSRIWKMRVLLPAGVPVFICTATLDKTNEKYILEKAGFDTSEGQSEIFRTTVDRPNISIIMQPLLNGFYQDVRRLNFLLDGTDSSNVSEIPKTIIYVPYKNDTTMVRYHIIQMLVNRGVAKIAAKKVVRQYNSIIRDKDKELILDEFIEEDGECRIMAATTSLGMGIDIPDIKRIVIWQLPLGPSPADYWQRVGRGMRSSKLRDEQGEAYIFAPSWVFDHLGSDESVEPVRRVRRAPQVQQQFRPRIPSNLGQFNMVAGEQSGNETDTSQASQASQTSQKEQEQDEQQWAHTIWGARKKKWSKAEIKHRKELPTSLSKLFNPASRCFRTAFLRELQEPDLGDEDINAQRVPAAVCCNYCNKDLGLVPNMTLREQGDKKPKAGSTQWMALEVIREFCASKAQDIVPREQRRFDIVPEMYMLAKAQNNLARQFTLEKQKIKISFVDTTSLAERVPRLETWTEVKKQEVLELCRRIQTTLQEDIDRRKAQNNEEKKKRNEEKKKRQAEASPQVTPRRRQTARQSVAHISPGATSAGPSSAGVSNTTAGLFIHQSPEPGRLKPAPSTSASTGAFVVGASGPYGMTPGPMAPPPARRTPSNDQNNNANN